jgi:hypothetical protein
VGPGGKKGKPPWQLYSDILPLSQILPPLLPVSRLKRAAAVAWIDIGGHRWCTDEEACPGTRGVGRGIWASSSRSGEPHLRCRNAGKVQERLSGQEGGLLGADIASAVLLTYKEVWNG